MLFTNREAVSSSEMHSGIHVLLAAWRSDSLSFS